jgi:hypothetical protein
MTHRSRFTAVPQLEVIRASDDTIRAELIAAPVVRTDAGDHLVGNPGAVLGMTRGEDAPQGPHSIA